MKVLLIIGSGGFIGSVLRYLLSQFVQLQIGSVFPFGTLIVNIIGCFVIGLAFVLGEKGVLGPEWRWFLITGICGGFTTFSAFSNETLALVRTGHTAYALSYVAASLVFGFLATFLAITVMETI